VNYPRSVVKGVLNSDDMAESKIFVAGAVESRLDASKEGKELLRAAGFERHEAQEASGLAFWKFNATGINKNLLLDLLTLSSGQRDQDKDIQALAEVSHQSKATAPETQDGEHGATSGGDKSSANTSGAASGASDSNSAAESGKGGKGEHQPNALEKLLKDEEDSGLPGGERFRSFEVDPRLIVKVFQDDRMLEAMSRHIAAARIAFMMLTNLTLAKLTLDDLNKFKAIPVDLMEQ